MHLIVDDSLVVKSSDLGGADRLIGLGSINLTLGGDLNVAKKAGEPLTLVGNVNTVRGFYDFHGRRFMIQRDGIVQFEGDPIERLNPRLAVNAERVISAVTARVSISGRLNRPELTLTSTPPLDPSDILALIVFNQPLNELGANSQQSVTRQVGDLAAGVATGQLTSSIASSLKLDQLEVNLSPDSGSAADLTIGQQISGNLYVRVQQGLGQHSQTNVILGTRILQVAPAADQRAGGSQHAAAAVPARPEHRSRSGVYLRVQIVLSDSARSARPRSGRITGSL